MRFTTLVLLASLALPAGLYAQDPPPPLPFPRPGSGSAPPAKAPAPPPASPAPPVTSAAPAAPVAPQGVPTDVSVGIPGVIYPTAEFLTTFDLGRGQRCHLFGTNMSYAEMLAYYKQVMKDGGRELTKAPAMQQFDLGRFQDETMATQPSVVIKDYTFGGSEGYLHVAGTQSKRFKTIIQIVPMPGR